MFWGRQMTAPDGGIRKVNDVRVVHGADSSVWLARLKEVRLIAAGRTQEVAARIASYESTRAMMKSCVLDN